MYQPPLSATSALKPGDLHRTRQDRHLGDPLVLKHVENLVLELLPGAGVLGLASGCAGPAHTEDLGFVWPSEAIIPVKLLLGRVGGGGPGVGGPRLPRWIRGCGHEEKNEEKEELNHSSQPAVQACTGHSERTMCESPMLKFCNGPRHTGCCCRSKVRGR